MAEKPVNSGKPWSQNDDNKLKDLAKHNTPTPLIAYKLGRTINAIYHEASKKNILLTPTNKSPYNRRKTNFNK